MKNTKKILGIGLFTFILLAQTTMIGAIPAGEILFYTMNEDGTVAYSVRTLEGDTWTEIHHTDPWYDFLGNFHYGVTAIVHGGPNPKDNYMIVILHLEHGDEYLHGFEPPN